MTDVYSKKFKEQTRELTTYQSRCKEYDKMARRHQHCEQDIVDKNHHIQSLQQILQQNQQSFKEYQSQWEEERESQRNEIINLQKKEQQLEAEKESLLTRYNNIAQCILF